jgi:hypothetical protein
MYSNNYLKLNKINSPRVNPSAGETKRVPKVEKAPDTGYIEDISALNIYQFKLCELNLIRIRLAYREITTQ